MINKCRWFKKKKIKKCRDSSGEELRLKCLCCVPNVFWWPFILQTDWSWNSRAHPHHLQLLSSQTPHSSLIGLATGPEPIGRLYETLYVLKARVTKPKRSLRLPTCWQEDWVKQNCCDWNLRKMCKGLAALPQTCLERWDMQHHGGFNHFSSSF